MSRREATTSRVSSITLKGCRSLRVLNVRAALHETRRSTPVARSARLSDERSPKQSSSRASRPRPAAFGRVRVGSARPHRQLAWRAPRPRAALSSAAADRGGGRLRRRARWRRDFADALAVPRVSAQWVGADAAATRDREVTIAAATEPGDRAVGGSDLRRIRLLLRAAVEVERSGRDRRGARVPARRERLHAGVHALAIVAAISADRDVARRGGCRPSSSRRRRSRRDPRPCRRRSCKRPCPRRPTPLGESCRASTRRRPARRSRSRRRRLRSLPTRLPLLPRRIRRTQTCSRCRKPSWRAEAARDAERSKELDIG